MSAAPESPLAERRLLLRARMRAQRESIALQLAAGARRAYPRSIAMRLLLQQPALVIETVSVLAGPRIAGRVHALTFLVRALSAFAPPATRNLPAIRNTDGPFPLVSL